VATDNQSDASYVLLFKHCILLETFVIETLLFQECALIPSFQHNI